MRVRCVGFSIYAWLNAAGSNKIVVNPEKPLRASLIKMFEAAGPADTVRGLRALGQLFMRDDDFGAFPGAHEIDGDQRVALFGARRSPGKYQSLPPPGAQPAGVQKELDYNYSVI